MFIGVSSVAKNLNCFANACRDKFIGVSLVAKNLNCFADARRDKFIGVLSVAKNLNCFANRNQLLYDFRCYKTNISEN